jgi:hypothetical protein
MESPHDFQSRRFGGEGSLIDEVMEYDIVIFQR